MRRSLFVLVGSLGLLACGDDGGPPLVDGVFTDAEWTELQTFTPLEDPPANPTNRFADDPQAAIFGQRMFHEKRYSGALQADSDLGLAGETGKVACATCHDPTAYFTDTRADNRLSIGTSTTGRNAPSLVNVVYYDFGNWAGAHDQFWKQGANSPESRDNTNGTRLAYAHVVFDHHKAQYEALFGALDPALDPQHVDAARFPPAGKPKSNAADPDGPWELMAAADQHIVNTIMANCGKATEAFERKLISRNSPFDHYVAGDYAALTAAAKRGAKLFMGKAACDGCHTGTTFTDNDFHNTGVPQTRDPQDQGQYDDIPKALMNTFNGAGMYSDDPVAGAMKIAGMVRSDDMRGKFRTKSLRHLTMTGPYFHDGSRATLEDVVRFYNDGGGDTGFPGSKDPLLAPLNLTDAEIADLVAFLESLTGEPVPTELTVNTNM